MTMTYIGATSTGANPPINVFSGLSISSTTQESGTLGWMHGNRIWFYSSTNAPADVAGVNAITDAAALGMRPGDLLLGITASGGTTTAYPWMGVIVASAASTSAGTFLSTAGGQIASNYNT